MLTLRAFFEPEAVAVVGAGRHRGKIGAEILHNLRATGFEGRLFAVNPSARDIDGTPSFPRLTDIPGAVDLAVICVPAAAVRAAVDDAIAKRVKAIVVISAGFAETGEAGRALEAELVAAVRGAGLRMVGPNCMGLLNTHAAVRLNATFSPVFPPHGRMAMSTQSGALGLAILDYAEKLGIGFSTFVSIGNKADVSSNDLLEYWEDDLDTDVVLLYLESFGNPRKFGQIARRLSRKKPIVAVKAGRSHVGARAASSHTGALASTDAVVDALFRQSGVIRTRTLEELFDVAAVLAHQPVPRGRNVAILTNAGGPAILAADACEAAGLALPPLSDQSVTALRSFLPPEASTGNPVDMIASATADQYERALTLLLNDDRVDSVIVVFVPPMVTSGEAVATAVKRAVAATTGKPVLAVFMSSDARATLLAPVPRFAFPEAAATALARITEYGEWLRVPDSPVPVFGDFDEPAARAVIESVLARGGGWTTPDETARMLTSARIAVAPAEDVSGADAAVAAARRIGYPVVLKATGPTIVHKTELGGIRLRLEDDAAVRDAYADLERAVGHAMTGALVQAMVADGVEMLVGCVEDAAFGPVLACGLGGTTTELLGDTSFRVAPITRLDAHAMIEQLRSAPLLGGYRGAPPADAVALRETLLRVSALAAQHPAMAEFEINPLLVRPSGVVAIDARIRIAQPLPRTTARRLLS